MILYTFLLCCVYAKVGILTPYKNPNLHLTVMKDTSIRFMPSSKNKDNKGGEKVIIDSNKFKVKVEGKPICKVEENSPLVSTCTDKVRYIDWVPVGEDGNWKFKTDDNLCLTVGGEDKKIKGYFVHALKCDQANDNQKFKFKSSKKKGPSFDNDIDEYGEGNILEFHALVMDDKKKRQVLITVKDDKNDKHYKTDTKELNNLFASGNHVKLMDHDFLVDRGITAKRRNRGSLI